MLLPKLRVLGASMLRLLPVLAVLGRILSVSIIFLSQRAGEGPLGEVEGGPRMYVWI